MTDARKALEQLIDAYGDAEYACGIANEYGDQGEQLRCEKAKAELLATLRSSLLEPVGEPYAWVVDMPLYDSATGSFTGPLGMDGTLHTTRESAEKDAREFRGVVVPLYRLPSTDASEEVTTT